MIVEHSNSSIQTIQNYTIRSEGAFVGSFLFFVDFLRRYFLCLTLITLSKIKESNKSLTTLLNSLFSHFPPIQAQFLCTSKIFYRFDYREMDKSPNFDHSTEIKWMIYFSVSLDETGEKWLSDVESLW